MNQLWTNDLTGKKYVFNSLNGTIYKSDVNGNPIKRYNTTITGKATFSKRIDFVERSAETTFKPNYNPFSRFSTVLSTKKLEGYAQCPRPMPSLKSTSIFSGFGNSDKALSSIRLESLKSGLLHKCTSSMQSPKAANEMVHIKSVEDFSKTIQLERISKLDKKETKTKYTKGSKRILVGMPISLRNENDLQRTETEWMKSINQKWVTDMERRNKLDLMLLTKRKNQKKTQYIIIESLMKSSDRKLQTNYNLPEIEK